MHNKDSKRSKASATFHTLHQPEDSASKIAAEITLAAQITSLPGPTIMDGYTKSAEEKAQLNK
jgi:hypothetical protein